MQSRNSGGKGILYIEYNGGILSGGFCPGGFCPGGFCPRGDFVQGDFVQGILSGRFCPGGFCPRTGGKILKPEDFELVKDNMSGRSVYAKIYSKKSGKVKCRISLGNSHNTISIEELVDEKFEGSCIIKLYQAYIGSDKSISLSVEEILARKIGISESYFEDEDSESDEE